MAKNPGNINIMLLNAGTSTATQPMSTSTTLIIATVTVAMVLTLLGLIIATGACIGVYYSRNKTMAAAADTDHIYDTPESANTQFAMSSCDKVADVMTQNGAYGLIVKPMM